MFVGADAFIGPFPPQRKGLLYQEGAVCALRRLGEKSPPQRKSLPCVKGGVSEADGGIVGRAVPAPTSFYRTPILNIGATNGRPPLCAPILFFLFLRKKRTAAPGEEKKENFQNRERKPCRHHVTAQLPGLIARPKSPFRGQLRAARYLDDGGQASAYEYGTP